MNETTRTLGGRYEIGEVLGRGGMAEVHLGHDSRLGRTVAIKLLRSDMARDPMFLARFRREAQSAASLNHPSIVAVYDTGEDVLGEPGGGEVHLPYIVMEHVAGRTLREVLTAAGGHGIGVERALAITAGVLTALDYSHHRGIVHRDIKPANVMLTPTGDVKVMDFGIARAVADTSATMTQTSAVIGTAAYLSPEQARGESVDARSDLYSTGCLLYELLTGRPPFEGDSAISVAYQHVRELPQPPSALNPEISDALDRVVLKALAKDRDDRYASAEEFRGELIAVHAGRPVSAPAVAVATAAATAALPTGPQATSALTAAGFAPATGASSALPEGFGTATGAQPAVAERRRTGLWVTLAVFLLLVLAALAVGAVELVHMSNRVTLPSETGRAYGDARTDLTNDGLAVTEVTRHDASPAGTVLSQSPGAGTKVDPRSTVHLTVSAGPSSVPVPDVTGLTETQAASELASAGLAEGSVSYQDDPNQQQDHVISTSPARAAQAAPGAKVNLVLASGDVDLPLLKGQTLAAAQQELAGLKLSSEVSYLPSAVYPVGTVIAQSPGSGSVDASTQVQLVVATAAPTPTPTATSPSTSTASPTSSPTSTDDPTSDPSGSPSSTLTESDYSATPSPSATSTHHHHG